MFHLCHPLPNLGIPFETSPHDKISHDGIPCEVIPMSFSLHCAKTFKCRNMVAFIRTWALQPTPSLINKSLNKVAQFIDFDTIVVVKFQSTNGA